jgi:hypothetical protein
MHKTVFRGRSNDTMRTNTSLDHVSNHATSPWCGSTPTPFGDFLHKGNMGCTLTDCIMMDDTRNN